MSWPSQLSAFCIRPSLCPFVSVQTVRRQRQDPGNGADAKGGGDLPDEWSGTGAASWTGRS